MVSLNLGIRMDCYINYTFIFINNYHSFRTIGTSPELVIASCYTGIIPRQTSKTVPIQLDG